jgi:hypothetical protein
VKSPQGFEQVDGLPGLAANNQPLIFDRFVHSNSSGSKFQKNARFQTLSNVSSFSLFLSNGVEEKESGTYEMA